MSRRTSTSNARGGRGTGGDAELVRPFDAPAHGCRWHVHFAVVLRAAHRPRPRRVFSRTLAPSGLRQHAWASPPSVSHLGRQIHLPGNQMNRWGQKQAAADTLRAAIARRWRLRPPLHRCGSVGVRGQNHMSDRSRQSVARCWGVC